MNKELDLEPLVGQWEAAGLWRDQGEWILNRGGALEYHPTPEEIAANCALLRTIDHWRPAHKRAPRGSKVIPDVAIGRRKIRREIVDLIRQSKQPLHLKEISTTWEPPEPPTSPSTSAALKQQA